MYGAAGDDGAEVERTAFRQAEKKYKLYKTAPHNSKKKKKGNAHQAVTDLSGVVDFLAALAASERGDDLPDSVVRCDCPGFDHPVFGFAYRPGFYFIPNAVSVEEQCFWIRESLRTFPQPPNRTNLTAAYGPIYDLFDAAKDQKTLIKVENSDAEVGNQERNNVGGNIGSNRFSFIEDQDSVMRDSCGSTAATTLLRKLRWSTLGLQFEWSKRNYDISLPHNKIPDALCLLANKMAAPAMSSGEEFWAEAAIVNYYGPSDMLGGHVDDMEADWTKPIVSISLGCKAIFLLGGKSREDIPTAMFLRSGDIVLMAGEARECFHGVPRIFTDTDQSEITPLISELSGKDDHCLLEYIGCSRININIRQVY